MYRNEEASDPLNNKLERQSLPSLSTVVCTGDWVSLGVLHFVKVQGGSVNGTFFGPKLHKRTVR